MEDITIKQMSFAYEKEHLVLDQISFSVRKNETIGIIGANGAGKSTLLKLMVGLLQGYDGELKICGTDVTKDSIRDIREKVGFIFQDSETQLFLSTVYEDVAFGVRNQGTLEENVKERVALALEKVHIKELSERQIYKLSGGQKKLVAIATVLSMQPEILLFDEPTVALDPKNRRNLAMVIRELEATKVIASHDLQFLKAVCDRVILLANGKVAAIGSPSEILNNQPLLEDCGL